MRLSAERDRGRSERPKVELGPRAFGSDIRCCNGGRRSTWLMRGSLALRLSEILVAMELGVNGGGRSECDSEGASDKCSSSSSSCNFFLSFPKRFLTWNYGVSLSLKFRICTE